MLRQLANSSRGLGRAAYLGFSRSASSGATHQEGNAVATVIAAVNASSSASLAAGGLNGLKTLLTPAYSAAGSGAASQGMSTQAKLMLGAAAGWFLYRADQQARSKDWIVDLALDVLQAAWIISYLSFIPFRSVYMSLRTIAPHTATPLQALRPAAFLK